MCVGITINIYKLLKAMAIKNQQERMAVDLEMMHAQRFYK
jgi:hypothetical protein